MRYRKQIVLCALLIIVLVIVLSLNMVWSWYISRTFDPFMENENLLAMPENNVVVARSRGWETHIFDDFDGSGYTFQIILPPRFYFGGGVNILVPTHLQVSEYYLSLTIFTGLGDWRYSLALSDLTSESSATHIHALASAVDRNGRPLGRHPGDSEEFYQQWLALHEKFYEPIMQLFDDIKDFFGEDAFR